MKLLDQLPPYREILRSAIDELRHMKGDQKIIMGKINALDQPATGCFATNDALANMSGLSNRTLRRHLKELVDRGLVVEARGRGQLHYRRVVLPPSPSLPGDKNVSPK